MRIIKNKKRFEVLQKTKSLAIFNSLDEAINFVESNGSFSSKDNDWRADANFSASHDKNYFKNGGFLNSK
jgi:hypothetical protein